jgi:hypothetical protein
MFDLDLKIIKLETPLPCGVVGKDGQICGNPAKVALGKAEAVPDPNSGEHYWRITPLCQECGRKRLGTMSKLSTGRR